MKDNYILVKTDRQQVLENVLFDLANLYRDTEYVHGMQLYRKKGAIDSFLIRFTNNPDFDRFSYFTNYLIYPIDKTDFSPMVRGFYQTSDIVDFPQLSNGKWIMMYVYEKDKYADNVYLVTEDNHTYIHDFGGNLKRIDEVINKFKKINIDPNSYHHIIDIYPAPAEKIPTPLEKNTEVKPWWKFW